MDYKKLHEETLLGLQKMVLEGKITEEIAKNICADFTMYTNDELIRRSLIKHFKEVQADNPSYVWVGIPVQNIISWLEHVGIITYALDAPIGQNLKGCPVCIEDLQNQNAGWSEEDKSRMNNLCHFLEEYGNQYYGHLTLQDTISWLKSLKDRIQPQREWNEEDKEQLDRALYMMEQLDMTKSWDDVYNWLKSIRPQNHWKPSEEQMKTLNEVINYCANGKEAYLNDYIYNRFIDLRDELNKL